MSNKTNSKIKEYNDKLLKCNNISDFITMFFGLPKWYQNSIFTEESEIEINKGDIFYRIRKDDGKTDFTNEKEWFLMPKDKINKVKQGRFNREKSSILYLGTDKEVLKREVQLQKNDIYWIATYKCIKDFKVGSFLVCNNKIAYYLHQVAMGIESKDKLLSGEKESLDRYFDKIDKNNLKKNKFLSLCAFENFSNFYDKTNKLGELILNTNKNGIRYCSSYSPMELSGSFECVTLCGEKEGNYALTEEGIKNIKFMGTNKEKCDELISLKMYIDISLEELNNKDK